MTDLRASIINLLRQHTVIFGAVLMLCPALASEPTVAVTTDGRKILIYPDGKWAEAVSPKPTDDKLYYDLPPLPVAKIGKAPQQAGTPPVNYELPNCIRTTTQPIKLIDRGNSFDLVFVLVNQDPSRFMIFDPMQANDTLQSLFINTRAAIEVFDNLGNDYNWQVSDFEPGELVKVKVLPTSEVTILFPVEEELSKAARSVSLKLVGMIKNGRDLQCQQIVIKFGSNIWTHDSP